MHDTEDKGFWVEYGANEEIKFVEDLAPRLGIKARLNPKKKEDPRVPDLLIEIDGQERLADLKKQETPFFKVKDKFPNHGFDPSYTVTFNVKDYVNYSDNYPQIYIVFWVSWEELTYEDDPRYEVKPVKGVWYCTFKEIQNFVASGAPRHNYKRRRGDMVNARDSYVLDLRKMKTLP